jgi:hypothetical protein
MDTNSLGRAISLGTLYKEDILHDYRYIGKLSGGYTIHRETGTNDYIVTFPHKHKKKVYLCCELTLGKYNSFSQVDFVTTSALFKGQNIAFRLYRYLILKRKVKLMAGSTQSIGARKLWAKLIRSSVIDVYAKEKTSSRKQYRVGQKEHSPRLTGKDAPCLYQDSDLQLFAVAA